MIKKLFEKSISDSGISSDDAAFLVNADLYEILEYSHKIKKIKFQNNVSTCAIINARSGLCSEDCTFCAQSSHHKTQAPVYDFIDLDRIRKASKELRKLNVERFSVVTSGITPTESEFELIIKAIKIIKDEGLLPDASVGCMTRDKLIKLKDAGLSAYHHNLETSRSFFPNICTTHSYDDDINTVKNAVDIGLYVCCGGIFGLGESWEQRIELAQTLKELKVQSVPVNFLNPIKGTPLENNVPVSEEEALRLLAIYRFMLPEAAIRVCGGRTTVFDEGSRIDVLSSGASGIMVGDYLTTKGGSVEEDLKNITKYKEAK